MFDSTKIMPAEKFAFTFKALGKGRWAVLSDGEHVGELDESGDTNSLESTASLEDVLRNFDVFIEMRPEYYLGHVSEYVKSLSSDPREHIHLFEHLLAACFLAKGDPKNEAATLSKLNRCLDWIRASTFYTDPASSVYHESYEGGLLHHTLKVAARLAELHDTPAFESVPLESAVLVALTHDWCKIGFYEKYTKNVKNEVTNTWEKVAAFRRTDSKVPLGHGAASMFMAGQFIHLSLAEAAAIRWHMGKWRCTDDENDELQRANEEHPLVHLVQFADQLSIVNYI